MRDLSRLTIVRIGSEEALPRALLEACARTVNGAFENAVRIIQITDDSILEAGRVETQSITIEAKILTNALNEEFGGHILGITDMDLIDSASSDFYCSMFGGKDSGNDVAVVSTHRLGSPASKCFGERLIKVALHEVGHNFDLVHHYSSGKTRGGAYCPMTHGDFNRFGERGYVETIIDSRGYRFCDHCRIAIQSHGHVA